jgi:NAD(P)H-hydrate epimerase
MAARAALRSGVGLVTVLTPASIAAVVAQAAPEAMVHAAAETEAGSLSAGCLRAWGRDMASFDAVLIGPGLTTHDESRRLTESLLRAVRSPLVVDADGLNVLAGDLDPVRRCGSPVMLTPHPGEMARLLGCSAADVQADRPGSARRAMARARAVVVLKGAGTVVAAPDRTPAVNMTGGPGMAKGGMGDVLAGLIAGLAAQGLEPFDAARLGVFVHGRAGDDAAWRGSQAGLTAGDVIRELAGCFLAIAGR